MFHRLEATLRLDSALTVVSEDFTGTSDFDSDVDETRWENRRLGFLEFSSPAEIVDSVFSFSPPDTASWLANEAFRERVTEATGSTDFEVLNCFAGTLTVNNDPIWTNTTALNNKV